ncbi:ammonia-forming cytochrome c nitrite reductase subunit c552 [Geothrix edaphica]|uniref:nitrite reductase (cytochrome; ammonia-forming) n=1 Tax=Geothrix edaphica TaxID=2927976 RepID=A0ABQ5PTY3_9BACT|nr:ammonia-forming cytochrome c nitrite reductase subunit c552 [Geothrix edaphica]GLH65828.1 cytochrome c-552 [Geothrix edaphica]
MNDNPTPLLSRPLVRMGLIAAGAALATVLVMALYASISSRKAEAKQTSFKLVDLDEKTVDPAQWGKNFPRQFDAYLKTSEKYSTKYGGAGSEGLPKSRIKEDPRLVTIFDGYAFAIDFNQRQGHAYMLDDQRNTKRVTERKQPGSCLHCHASNTVAFRELGLKGGAPGTLDEAFSSPNAQAQLMAGFEALCKMPYADATKLVKHPVACIDCHDPKNMALRVTKPGFIRGIVALANSAEPVPHLPSIEKWRKGDKSVAYDANRDASRQELRSMVCGQCHVEYYCGPKVTLFFPWNKGLKVEQIEATYDEYKFPDGHRFFDWQHAKTGAEVLKAQHPEFEMWSQGIHARSGVSCADCHMPYVREGALKISDHQVRSPLLNISRSCQTCHRFPEEELKARVTSIQDRTKALMDRAEDAVVNLIDDIAAAKKAGVDEGKLKPIYELQRKAQWRVDFVNAENSMGFHAPQEVARILGEAIDYGRQGQVALRDLGVPKVAKK